MIEETKNNNKFRNSINSRYLKALFYETNTTNKNVVLYTLKDHDYLEYPSLYRMYMEAGDPTEWEFANTYLEGWEHWKMLQACTWFKPYLLRWREELDTKIKSQALKVILSEMEKGGKDSYGASKTVLDGKWRAETTTSKRGRPTKADVTQAAEDEAARKAKIKEDLQRMNIE